MECGGCSVLVPLDGSPEDVAVASLAAAVAAGMAGELVLMRVVRPTLPPLFPRRLPPAEETLDDCDLIARMGEAVRQAEAELQEIESLISGPTIMRVVLVSSSACARIQEWLRGHPTAIVVMAAARAVGSRRVTSSDLATSIRRSGLAPVVVVECRAAQRPASTIRSRPRRNLRLRCRSQGERSRSL